jgi:Skp family chaperone for outer membrane proteins
MKMSCVATVLTATLLIAGCGTERSGGVAVVDLDRVANELGRSAVMLQRLQQQQNGLNQKLASVKTSFEQQISENFEKLPEEPSEEEAAKLLNMKRNANIQLASYKKQATSALGQLKNSAIAGFRAEAMPIARDAAKERGMSVVLTTNDSVVFAFDKAVDITDDVIARMEKSAPKTSAVAMAPLKTTPAAAPSGDTAVAAPTETDSNE